MCVYTQTCFCSYFQIYMSRYIYFYTLSHVYHMPVLVLVYVNPCGFAGIIPCVHTAGTCRNVCLSALSHAGTSLCTRKNEHRDPCLSALGRVQTAALITSAAE